MDAVQELVAQPVLREREQLGPPAPPTLGNLSQTRLGAAMAMQSADVTPKAGQVAACDSARVQSRGVMARWLALRTSGLSALNVKRKAAGLPIVGLPKTGG